MIPSAAMYNTKCCQLHQHVLHGFAHKDLTFKVRFFLPLGIERGMVMHGHHLIMAA